MGPDKSRQVPIGPGKVQETPELSGAEKIMVRKDSDRLGKAWLGAERFGKRNRRGNVKPRNDADYA
jgi:hypothetical protein